jgi:Flp pilus assembly protein TadD
MIYAQNGDKEKARVALEQALKLSSNFEGAAEARKTLTDLKG